MNTPTKSCFVLAVALSACEPPPITSEGSETGATSETSTTETGGAPGPTCACVELDMICEAARPNSSETAMQDCDLPMPCFSVDGDNESARCVLQLLIDQEPARFRYRIGVSDMFSSETWSGLFYIVGPGEGIDNECHTVVSSPTEPILEETTARVHALADPDYFQACLDGSMGPLTSCLFDGLSPGDEVSLCSG